MSRINTKDYPSLGWFAPAGAETPIGIMPPPGNGLPPNWLQQSRIFKTLLVTLLSDIYTGKTYVERLQSKRVDPTRKHLQKRYYLADTIFMRMDTDQQLRKRLWPLVEELPDEGGIILFMKGGQYVYKICDEWESRIYLDDPTLFPQAPPLGARFFMTCLLTRDVFCGFECGFIYQGQSYVSNEHSIYPLGSDQGQYISFVGTTLLFLRFAETETKLIGPNAKEGRRTHLQNCKYVNETNFNVEVVDSRWFTTLIRSDGFKVNGHFRLQPCGEGKQERKLIWIADYQKEGYIRQAKVDGI